MIFGTLALFLLRVAAAQEVLRVGLLLSRPGPLSYFGDHTEFAAQLWQKHVNDMGAIGNFPVRVELVARNVSNSKDQVRAAVQDMENLVDIYIAPYSSSLTEVAAVQAHRQKKLMIAGGSSSLNNYECQADLPEPCTTVGDRRFKYLSGVMTSAVKYFEPWVSLLQLRQAKSLSMIMEDHGSTRSACQGAKQRAKESGIEVVYERIVAPDAAIVEPEVLDEIVQEFAAMESAGELADALLGCVYVDTCIGIVERLAEYNVNFKGLAMSICVGIPSVSETLGDKVRYLSGSDQWDSRLTGELYAEGANTPGLFPEGRDAQNNTVEPPKVFAQAYEKHFGELPDAQAASSMAAFYLLHSAIVRANSTDVETLVATLPLVREPSFYGVLSQGTTGTNFQKPMVTMQYSDVGEFDIVSPLTSAGLEFIYPIPRWDEREYKHAMFVSGEEKAVLAILSVSIVITMVLIIIMATQHAHPVIRKSSVPTSIAVLVGCVVCFFAPFSWSLEETQATCRARPWLFFGATCLPVAPLLAKLLLVTRKQRSLNRRNSTSHMRPPSRRPSISHSVSSSSSTQPHNTDKLLVQTHDTNLRAWGMLTTGLVVPQFLLCVLWVISAPLKLATVVPDAIRPVLNYTVCEDTSASLTFARLTLAYSGALLAGCLVCAVYLRVFGADHTDSFYSRVNVLFALFTLAVGVGLTMVFTHLQCGTRAQEFLMRSLAWSVSVHAFMWTLFSKTVIVIANHRFTTHNSNHNSIKKILASPVRRAYLRQYMRKQVAEENIDFVEAVLQYRHMHDMEDSTEAIRENLLEILAHRMESGSDEQVNISANVREATIRKIRSILNKASETDKGRPPRDLFDHTMVEVSQVITTNSLPGFLKETLSRNSDEVRQWCLGASLLGSDIIVSVMSELELILTKVRRAERAATHGGAGGNDTEMARRKSH